MKLLNKYLILVFSNYQRIAIFLVFLFVANISCKKYLDQPPSKNQVIPSTLSDLQALLQFIYQPLNSPLATELDDDHFLTDAIWQYLNTYGTGSLIYNNQTQNDALHYLWQGKAITSDGYWARSYQSIYYPNLVLERLSLIPKTSDNAIEWNRIKGQALFVRSFCFWYLAQLYCKPYDVSWASNSPGIVLKLNTDFDQVSVRASIQETYDQIVNDLKFATQLLPESTIDPTRPNKAAAFGMLARVYLSMRLYNDANYNADSCLTRTFYLLDYNSLNSSAPLPIPLFNKEVLFFSSAAQSWATNPGFGIVDTILYRSFNVNDLRKAIFFRGAGNNYNFQGSYTTRYWEVFDGVATDEIYLIRAECLARTGDKDGSLLYLNNLRKTRWRNTVLYPPIVAANPQDALDSVLVERRKELCFRDLRWTDLRRLNLEGRNITLKRKLNGTIYSLTPGDLRWVQLIPQDVINYSGMQQNPR